jgi:hypothetical protein
MIMQQPNQRAAEIIFGFRSCDFRRFGRDGTRNPGGLAWFAFIGALPATIVLLRHLWKGHA